jgi:hypothetical protein
MRGRGEGRKLRKRKRGQKLWRLLHERRKEIECKR